MLATDLAPPPHFINKDAKDAEGSRSVWLVSVLGPDPRTDSEMQCLEEYFV